MTWIAYRPPLLAGNYCKVRRGPFEDSRPDRLPAVRAHYADHVSVTWWIPAVRRLDETARIPAGAQPHFDQAARRR
jgi:hypothetical protein